jgi:uncharacterized membrane protein YqiK
MSKRRLADIITELANETAKDGYFGRKQQLEAIVEELIDELEYTGAIKIIDRGELS